LYGCSVIPWVYDACKAFTMIKKILFLSVIFFAFTHVNAQQGSLQQRFVHPPDSLQTSVYWYWISGNISKEGVIKDLQAMKRVGINRAFIGNIGYDSTPYGSVKMFSDEWWDIMHAALKTATELNIQIGIFNGPGWSQSGGPWIKPEQSMRYLTSSEVRVKGGKTDKLQLKKPGADFQDVRVIAFKAPKNFGTSIMDLKPKISTSAPVENIGNITDGNQSTETKLPAQKTFSIDIETAQDFTARSITVYPAHNRLNAKAEILAEENGTYKSIKTFAIDRDNDALNVGFDPYGPVAVSLPATTAHKFRIVFSDASSDFGVAELNISTAPVVERYIEKTLAKMFQTPLPYWNEYQWKPEPVINDQQTVIDPNSIVDISTSMTVDGSLTWKAPAGDWVIMRTGMVPTGVKNGPAPPEGTGYEVDKMNKDHIAGHFNAFLGEIMKRIPAEDRKTWKVAVEDSYETGGQNWTDGLAAKFKTVYGYDPLPYLPTLKGYVVGSQDQSDRFLWDLRRFIADRVAYDYVGGLRDVSHQHGLTTWLENYGHWGFPGEFLQYGGQSDEVGGEFWSEGDLGNIENRAASSSAHIYGKTKVSAESFTAGGGLYLRYPYLLKKRGDRFFTEGINNTLLHVFISQPSDDKMPGINANFGTEFNRHNTWFNYMDLFTAYLKRTNLMLQQGKYVADVAYFIGEDAPKMTGVTDPKLPFGYSYDYINAEVIKNRVKVVDGKMVLPDGMSYNLLVLPKLETMRPELLRKIKDLVQQGAHIYGPAPERSPSLQEYPAADSEVKKLATELWGKVDGTTTQQATFGKGTVMAGMNLQAALNVLNVAPDFELKFDKPVLYIHRTLPDMEIYYVSNQNEEAININPGFKVSGRQPEAWDAVTGETRILPEFSSADNITTVPLTLQPLQSLFIIFRKPVGDKVANAVNFPKELPVTEIKSPWQVTFDAKMRGPRQPVMFNTLTDWTLSTNDSIKYYAGTAIYKNTVKLPKPIKGQHLYLNLGDVKLMAKVKVNGTDVGGVWTYPYRVDITDVAKKGDNSIEISVVNNWVNRLIGDSKLPAVERKTWTSYPLYDQNSKLQSSGLMGPVTVTAVQY
jgi:hypothetical protein